MKKINILHIITHDTGRYLECYGYNVRTPNINKVAEEGVIFTNYFTTAPQCSPSRASEFSSLYPHNTGVFGLAHRGFILNENIPYLPKILAENGYNTFLFGIQHVTNNISKLGYQKCLVGPTRDCEKLLPHVINFLENDPPEPFFISVGFFETHRPFPVVENIPNNIKVPNFLPDEYEIKKDLVGLNILVEKFDKCVGEIVRTLEKKKIIDRTLIILTTDHGISFPGAKATLFDPGIETFLIIKGPDFEGGKKINSLLSNLDLTPTILDYLGIEIPKIFQGVSFLSLVKGGKRNVRDKIYIELTYHAAYDPMRGIRTEKYKYIKNFEVRPFYFLPNVDSGFSKELFKKKGYFEKLRPFEFLFDLENDPFERRNLAGNEEYHPILESFRKELREWMEKTNDPLLKGPACPPPNAQITPPWAEDPEEIW